MPEFNNMNKTNSSNGITCPIFQKREWTIKELTRDINAARSISDKAEMAIQLKNEVTLLLSCEEFDGDNINCRNCRIISGLRKKTAELLIKAKGLG